MHLRVECTVVVINTIERTLFVLKEMLNAVNIIARIKTEITVVQKIITSSFKIAFITLDIIAPLGVKYEA